MTFKSWLGRRGSREEQRPPEIDDLIILERFEEAEKLLGEKLSRRPGDRHARLKLADLYMRTDRRSKALDEYIAVAEVYSRDGFHDNALALLAKVSRLLPGNEKIALKVERLEREKRLEHRRRTVIDALVAPRDGQRGRSLSVVEAQRIWTSVVHCSLVDRLTEEQLRRLFGAFEVEKLDEGAALVRRDERRDEMFLVVEGGVEVRMNLADGSSTVLRSLEPGTLFGERALLEHCRWPADHRAAGPSVLLRLDRTCLEQALVGNADPRALLEALREQRVDAKVAAALRRAG